jgi:hypothetical protein
MPIRFRCTACGGVLSIARRKAGSNVLCPKCAVTLVVPGASTVPDPEKVEVPVRGAVAGEPVITGRAVGPNGKKSSKPAEDPPLFERLDFESLLQPAVDQVRQKKGPASAAAAEKKPSAKSPPEPQPSAPPRFTSRSGPKPDKPEREKPAPAPAQSFIQITPTQLIAIAILVFCLVGMGVGVGYALGR